MKSNDNSIPSSSLLKSLIKSTRESIDKQDFATALRLSETGLNEDAENYTLLVFKALSLQNLQREEEALKVYRLATTIHPEQILAWQGMAGLLEKLDKWHSLVEPLERLFTLSKETEKKVEINKRLVKALEETNRIEECIQKVHWLRLNDDEQKRLDWIDREIEFMERNETEKIKKEIEVRRFRLGADPLPILAEKVKNEIFILSNLDAILRERLNMSPSIEIGEKLIDRLFRKIPSLSSESEKHSNSIELLKLCKEYSNSPIAARLLVDTHDHEDIFKVSTMANNFAYEECKEASFLSEEGLDEVFSKYSHSLFVNLVLTIAYWDREEIGHCQKYLLSSIKCINTLKSNYSLQVPKVLRQLKRLEGLLFSKDGRWEDAVALLEEAYSFNNNDIEVRDKLINCYDQLKEYQKVINIYNQIPEKTLEIYCELGWRYYLSGQLQVSLDYLRKSESLCQVDGLEDPILLTRIGRVYWELDENNRSDKDICLSYFLRAAKADPDQPDTFFYLALYYYEVELDMVRAEKCLTKVLNLSNDHLDAALLLVQIWINSVGKSSDPKEKLQRVIRLLEPFCEDNFRCSKLWGLLGIAFSGVEKYPQSTIAFQNSLKGDHPDEKRCLLGMADGYAQQGRLTAAYKAYQRVLEIDPMNVTAEIGLSKVDQLLHDYDSSRLRLSKITHSQKEFKPAIDLEIVIASYKESLECIRIGCINEAIGLIQKCLLYFENVLGEKDSSYNILRWKTLSDICLCIFRVVKVDLSGIRPILIGIAERMSLESQGNEVWSDIRNVIPESLPSPLKEALFISILSQINIILYSEDEVILSDAWTDIAISLLYSRNLSESCLGVILDCCEQALTCSKLSNMTLISKGLALMYSKSFGMSQHCFVQSIYKDPKSNHGWLMLSFLYRLFGDVELSLAALEKIQISEPENSSFAWLFDAYLRRTTIGSSTLEGKWEQSLGIAVDLAGTEENVAFPLWILKMSKMGSLNAEQVSLIRHRAMLRLAMNPSDQLMKDILLNLNAPVTSIGREAAYNLQSSSPGDDFLTTFKIQFPDSTPDISWIQSLIELQDPLKAFSIQLESLDKNLFSSQAWEDASFWYNTCLASTESPEILSSLERNLEDWLRLRMTPELVSKITIPIAIETILGWWKERIPDDIARTLKANYRFIKDFNSNNSLISN